MKILNLVLFLLFFFVSCNSMSIDEEDKDIDERLSEKEFKELENLFSDFPFGIDFYKKSLCRDSPYYPPKIFYPDRRTSGLFVLYLLNPTLLSKLIGTQMQADFIKRVLFLYLDYYNFHSIKNLPQTFLPENILFRLDGLVLSLKDTYWIITRNFITRHFKLKEPFPAVVEDVSCYIIAFGCAGYENCAYELKCYLRNIIHKKLWRRQRKRRLKPSLRN